MEPVEFRSWLELRAIGKRLIGIAAPYGVEATISSFREVFKRGCWTASLSSGADVVALQDHDAGRLLGRVKSGTLTLADEARGLGFTLSLPDTQAGRDVEALAIRNDLGGVSVGMIVVDQSWSANLREIRSATLVEVSIVSTFPAYPDTSVALRSRDQQSAGLPLDPVARRRLLDRL